MSEPVENKQEESKKGQPGKRVLLVTYGWPMDVL
jgi:hypothetical protein